MDPPPPPCRKPQVHFPPVITISDSPPGASIPYLSNNALSLRNGALLDPPVVITGHHQRQWVIDGCLPDWLIPDWLTNNWLNLSYWLHNWWLDWISDVPVIRSLLHSTRAYGSSSKCLWGGGHHVSKRQPYPSMTLRNFPDSVCLSSPLILPFLTQPPMLWHTTYKQEGVSLWFSRSSSLLLVHIGTPVLSGHTTRHPNISTSPMPRSPFLLASFPPLLRCNHLFIGLGSACNPGKYK